MAEAHAKHHDYHLVEPSAWPLVGSIGAFVLAVGAVHYFHGAPLWWIAPGLLIVLYTMFGWWSDVLREANKGDHTPVVQLHLRYGMILFIASEVMFFVDPKIVEDDDTKNIGEITLSYTFYRTDKAAGVAAAPADAKSGS
jgi:hypothetical protein